MWTRLHISAFIGVAVAAWTAVLFAQGTPVSMRLLAPFSTVVGIMVLAGLAFEHWLWSLPLLHGWFVKRPNLRGTWRVVLRSSWKDAETGLPVPEITAFMGITQTLSHLNLHLMTAESESWLIASSIAPSQRAEGYQVAGVYTNQPTAHLRSTRSPMHYGALVLFTHGKSQSLPDRMTGEYWTDRSTTGELQLERASDRVFTNYADAVATSA
jgi:hypothetical protein